MKLWHTPLILADIRIVCQISFICVNLSVETASRFQDHRESASADINCTPMGDAFCSVDLRSDIVHVSLTERLDRDTLLRVSGHKGHAEI